MSGTVDPRYPSELLFPTPPTFPCTGEWSTNDLGSSPEIDTGLHLVPSTLPLVDRDIRGLPKDLGSLGRVKRVGSSDEGILEGTIPVPPTPRYLVRGIGVGVDL